MGVKRTARLIFQKAFDVHLVYRGTVAPVFERDHLHEFFSHFEPSCLWFSEPPRDRQDRRRL